MIEAVITRLETLVPELAGRIEGAVDFAELVRSGNLPQHGVSAHVVPLGLRAKPAQTAAGSFVQGYTETLGVILTARSDTPTGKRILGDIRGFLFQVIEALCGWAPGNEIGVFTLAGGGLSSADRGAFAYRIEFSIDDQLRITP